ncbi:hypothetical protein [Winogradskyella forsetii]|uniref:hypothetical protein n=2 Tax=Winogradskyella forsetii TaxID=2686077 RepID=UPI0015B84D26|nr:hypothetical protein [Winogradskyella forsetii]
MRPKISQTQNSDDIRVHEIKKLIENCRYSIHDISRIEPISKGDLPRFNMPFELGIDVGCKTYLRKNKKYMILEKEPYRFKEVMSDISGQDIFSHNNEPYELVKVIRNWYKTIFPRRDTNSSKVIWDAYNEFNFDFKEQMESEDLNPENIWAIPFNELIEIMQTWIKNYA